ncbi:hypothetical protein [Marinoscillum sp.]|uniref:hypothetical protein n=1 Tax=Marinoscillum sp. TaxID=2024838 RepID=UPI003BACE4F4
MRKNRIISLILLMSFFAFLMEAEKNIKPYFSSLKESSLSVLHLSPDSTTVSAHFSSNFMAQESSNLSTDSSDH